MKSKPKNAKSPPSGDKKKDTVKNGKKTVRGKNKGMFAKDNQPENKGRPKGSEDFKTVFNRVTKDKGKDQAIEILWQEVKNKNFQAIKLVVEYLFEKPTQTIKSEIVEPLSIIVESKEQEKKLNEL